MAKGDVITTKEVASWFKVFRFDADSEDIEPLVDVLNTIRVTKPTEEAVHNPPELARVAGALNIILTDAPILLDILRDAIVKAGPDAVRQDVIRREKLMKDLARNVTIAKSLCDDPFFAPKGKKRRTALWHMDLSALAFLLRRAAKKHGVVISLTKSEGSGVKFIRRALARAGIHKDLAAIAQAIGRRKSPRVFALDH